MPFTEREVSARRLNKALRVLAHHGIPRYVWGGIAVQEHGFLRATVDVDLIVPDAAVARRALVAGGFDAAPDSLTSVTDVRTGVRVDLFAGGRALGGPVTLPMPRRVSRTPRVLELGQLSVATITGLRA